VIAAAQTSLGSINQTNLASNQAPTAYASLPHTALYYRHGYIWDFSTRYFTSNILYSPLTGLNANSALDGPSPLSFSFVPTTVSGSISDWDDYALTFAEFTNVNAEAFAGSGFVWSLDTASSENYIRTIVDSDPNDDLSWGMWSLPVLESFSGGSPMNTTLQGYFVSGNVTPSAVIQQKNSVETYGTSSLGTSAGMVTGTYYLGTGAFPGSVATTDVDTATSTVQLAFNFGTGQIDTFLLQLGGTNPATLNLLTSHGSINAAESSFSYDGANARYNGKFFGNQGDKAGGTFLIDGGAYEFWQGAFQATKQ
jgi:hypothetical protein